MNRFGSGVGPGSGDHLHASGIVLDGDADDFEVFLGRDGGGFPSSADGEDPGDAGSSLAINEGAEGIVINGAVAERGNERGIGALKHEGRFWRILPLGASRDACRADGVHRFFIFAPRCFHNGALLFES